MFRKNHTNRAILYPTNLKKMLTVALRPRRPGSWSSILRKICGNTIVGVSMTWSLASLGSMTMGGAANCSPSLKAEEHTGSETEWGDGLVDPTAIPWVYPQPTDHEWFGHIVARDRAC